MQATVADKCEGCGSNDIDLSPSAFTVLAPKAKGRIPVTWNYLYMTRLRNVLALHLPLLVVECTDNEVFCRSEVGLMRNHSNYVCKRTGLYL